MIIDFNMITIWIVFLICGIWLLSLHGIWVYTPLLMMTDFIFWITLAIMITIQESWLPSSLNTKTWMFYYG